jgi:hypothetical protein
MTRCSDGERARTPVMTTAPKAARQIFLSISNLNAGYARRIEANALRTKKYEEETPTQCT